jgi:CheY-like chemotaxis protein
MDPRRVLVIDDELEFTHMLKLALEMGGNYDVREAFAASRVIEIAKEFHPDIILLDCMMPELAGAEVAAQLQADPALKHIPFVFLTATVARLELRPDAAGVMQTYLPKPLRLPMVIECIEEKIERSHTTH